MSSEMIVVTEVTIRRPNGQQQAIALLDPRTLEASGQAGYAIAVRVAGRLHADASLLPIAQAVRAMFLLEALLRRTTTTVTSDLLGECCRAVYLDSSKSNEHARALERKMVSRIGHDLFRYIVNLPVSEMPDWVKQRIDT